MTLPGETIAMGASEYCPDCNKQHILEVLHSPAGYYIGTGCDCQGFWEPYSRESGYYQTKELAEEAMKDGGFERT